MTHMIEPPEIVMAFSFVTYETTVQNFTRLGLDVHIICFEQICQSPSKVKINKVIKLLSFCLYAYVNDVLGLSKSFNGFL